MPPLEPYSRGLSYSYALGLYPAMQALVNIPERVSRVLISSKLGAGEGAQALLETCRNFNIRVEEADRVLRRVSGKDNVFAAAVYRKESAALDREKNHLVLVNPMDAGNLGTILRAALGFSYTQVALILPCADKDEPQTVRAGMGALFSLNVAEFPDFETYQRFCGERAFYPFLLSDRALPLLEAVKLKKSPHSLIFGNEGSGLPDSFMDLGQQVMIEQSDKIDSLNLAIAAAVGMHAFKNIQ
ncbi:MAG: TrmH family RNA methyltransferase [Bacillota bacterium]|nr:TrmH family RNA methyltransferase [Bacillota bacterium]